MKTENNNGLEISYKISGEGNPVLLFIHGSFNDQTYWKEQIAVFENSYKVITMDLAGHGQSGKNRNSWTIEDFGTDVSEVIKQLDLQNVILIGHSLGADAALEAAINLPDAVTGFIAIDYFKNIGTSFPKDQVEQIVTGLKTDFANGAENYAKTGLLTKETPNQVTERIVNAYRSADPEMGIKSIQSLFQYSPREIELLKKLQVKLHLINVDYQPTNEQALEKVLHDRYTLQIIKGTSHFPMIENPDSLNSALEETLNQILAEVAADFQILRYDR